MQASRKKCQRLLRTCIFCAGVFACSTSAYADELQNARELYLQADFRKAMEGFELILRSPDLNLTTAGSAHAYLAALRYSLHDVALAKKHIEASLAADQTQQAPEGSSKELQQLFDTTKKKPPVFSLTATNSKPRKVTSTLSPSPQLLIEKLQLQCSNEQKAVISDRSFPPKAQVELPSNWQRANCTSIAITSYGAPLFRKSLSMNLMNTESLSENNKSGIPAWIWIGAGVIVAGVGVAITAMLISHDGQPEIDETVVEGW